MPVPARSREVPSRGSPDFRVHGKTFATYVINHHGDGRIALWLNAPDGAQAFYAENEPKHYFVPPYVGPRGWLGVHLDKGLSWSAIGERVWEAYAKVAPPKLRQRLDRAPEIEPPTDPLPIEAFDPLARPRAQAVLAELRDICLALPETTEGVQFGNPVFRAGKEGLCRGPRPRRPDPAAVLGGRRPPRGPLAFDERYRIPAYIGHNGWMELDAEGYTDRPELEALAMDSYRHFALQRMLKALPAPL